MMTTMNQMRRQAAGFGGALVVLLGIGAMPPGAVADSALPVVGAPAPAYTLPDQDGKTHTSAKDLGKVTLLAFYPADFTGGCTIEAHSLSAAYPQLKALGVTVYGVSVQDAKSHKAFCTKEGIPYTLLADTDKTAAKAYGVLTPDGNYANRVTFIVGRDGNVAYVDSDVNGHLLSCGTDWVAWLKAHPSVTAKKSAEASPGNVSPNVPRLTYAALTDHPAQTATVGKPAPAFSLPDAATGQKTSLTAIGMGKKATVLLFVATRCPVSNAYNTRMSALAKKYSPRGIAFVGINANTTESMTEVAGHAKAHLAFPVLKDADDAVANAYRAKVTPEAYVVGAGGVLLYHGRLDNSMDPGEVKTHDLADALDAVLAGKPVAANQAAAFGCSIKRGE